MKYKNSQRCATNQRDVTMKCKSPEGAHELKARLIPLLASLHGGVAARSKNVAKHPINARTGWFSDEDMWNTTPPCDDARRGIVVSCHQCLLLCILVSLLLIVPACNKPASTKTA